MTATAKAAEREAEPKHAPGPWTFTDHGDRRHKEFAIISEGGKIASVYAGFGAHFDWPTSEANASLIAAAPDLLEALKMAIECIAYCRRAHKDAQTGEGVPVEIFLDAAIAKAGVAL